MSRATDRRRRIERDSQDVIDRLKQHVAHRDRLCIIKAPPGSGKAHTLLEAIGTAVWAHQVGDEVFEAQGHRMISDVLSEDS